MRQNHPVPFRIPVRKADSEDLRWLAERQENDVLLTPLQPAVVLEPMPQVYQHKCSCGLVTIVFFPGGTAHVTPGGSKKLWS